MKQLFILFVMMLMALPINVMGRITESDISKLGVQKNAVSNGGFENGTANWTAVGGVFSIDTNSANVGVGNASGKFETSAASQTLTSDTINLAKVDIGKPCGISISAKGDGINYEIQMLDATDSDAILESATLTANPSTFEDSAISYTTCPASIKVRVASIADGDIVYIDNIKVGKNVYRTVLIQEENDFTGVIQNNGTASIISQGGFNSVGVNAVASVEWLSTGVVKLHFVEGFFSVAPAITALPTDMGSTINQSFSYSNLSASSVTLEHYYIWNISTQGLADVNFSFTLSRQKADYKPIYEHLAIPATAGTEVFYASERAGFGSTNTHVPYFTNVHDNTLDKYASYTNDATYGNQFLAKQDIIVTARYSKSYDYITSGQIGFTKGITGAITSGITTYINTDKFLGFDYRYSTVIGIQPQSTGERLVKKGEYFQPHVENPAALYHAARSWVMVTIRPVNVELMAAIPEKDTAIFSWDENNTAITPVTGENIITLNKVEKAASFASLSANKVTIAKGKYRLTWNTTVGANNGYWLGKGFIKNLTTSEQLGIMMIYVGCPTAAYYNFSTISGTAVVELTEATDFNLVVERTGGSLTSPKVGYDSGNIAFDRKAEFTVTEI